MKESRALVAGCGGCMAGGPLSQCPVTVNAITTATL